MLFSFAFDNLGGNTELKLTRTLAQDDDGMIWFGTDRGLQSYDGYDFSTGKTDGHGGRPCQQIRSPQKDDLRGPDHAGDAAGWLYDIG